MRKSTFAVVMALILISVLGFSSFASAEETSLEPTGIEARRDDALLLNFRDGGTAFANESGYKRIVNSESSSGTKSNLYNAVLPLCDVENTFGCIKSVEIKKTTENTWELLTPGEKFHNSPIASSMTNADGTRTNNLWETWIGDAKVGLPPSGKVQLFDSKIHSHGGGTAYVVKANVRGNGRLDGPFEFNQFGLSIKAVKATRYDAISKQVSSVQAYRFPENLEFRFSVKLGALYPQLNGWFFGRITDAQIELDPKEQLLIVSGRPTATPIQSGYMPFPFPDEFKDEFKSVTNPKSTSVEFSPSLPIVLDKWLKFQKVLNPKASYESDVWKIDAAPKSFLRVDQNFQNCVGNKPGISGLLTTNATVYSQNPPEWNSKDSTLTYQVAGPEFLSDGRKNLGNYLLAMRTDVASCLWKSDLKNAKATVEVTNGNGTAGAQVATTTLSQKNGWIYFSAAGFHFSAPSITVKLIPETAKLNPEKILKITCIKGKTKKTITGTNPKCPSGYKKS